LVLGIPLAPRVVLIAVFALAIGPVRGQESRTAAIRCPPPPDPCSAPRRAGEVAVAFLGDAGFGEGGASEWGSHAQAAVARQLEKLCPRPDLVVFLGDNIYWEGSPDLFGPRFDTMYPHLLDPERRRVHAALGNHDVQGCAVSTLAGFGPGQTCLDALRLLLEREPPAQGEAAAVQAVKWLDDSVAERATSVPGASCPSPFEKAYEQDQASGQECFAAAALRHPAFGYGTLAAGSLRYYTVDRPPAADAPGEPFVRVLVADSDTLDVAGGVLARHGAATRRDDLQALWIENQLRTAPAGAWTVLAMHHPPYTPRGCVFKLAGCLGGHGDETGLQAQLRPALAAENASGALAPWRPDLVMTAHNHFYARTHPLDALGQPTDAGGVRYFVTGGGGAPLYRMRPPHARYARTGSFHHFVYMRLRAGDAFFWTIDDKGGVRDAGCFEKGAGPDRAIALGPSAPLPAACAAAAPASARAPTVTRSY
jgi:hypothetical protein